MKKIILPLFAIVAVSAYAQERTITGQVVDENGFPVAGASVFVPSSVVGEEMTEGTISNNALGTITDANGNYTLSVPADVKQISISYDGFDTKTIAVNNQNSTYDVTLLSYFASGTLNLDDLVVTGYQKIDAEKMTSAVATIEMEDIQQKGIASVDQMLEGQIAGVNLQNTTGRPGEIGDIQIRGISTLRGISDPLWVVDGVPLEGNNTPDLSDKNNLDELRSYSIAGINPEDIEKITVLKDASATSIYGARAANGVIVVTTKNGKKGGMKVNLSSNTFINFQPDSDKINLMNSQQKVDFELGLAKRTDLEYRTGNGAVAKILQDAGVLEAYKNGEALPAEVLSQLDALKSNQVNWWKELYRTSINQQYTASVSGGGDVHNYYASLGYYDEQGALKGNDYERINLTFKNNFDLSDKLSIGLNIFGTSIDQESYLTDQGSFTNPNNYLRTVNPYQRIYDDDGNYVYDDNINYATKDYTDFVKFNIIEERANTHNEMNSLQLKGNLDLNYKIVKGLNFRSLFGIQLEKNNTEKWASENSYYNRVYKFGTRYYDGGNQYWLPEGGILQNFDTDYFHYMWRNNVEYDRSIGQHDFNVMAGIEIRKENSTLTNTKAFGYNEKTNQATSIIFRNETDATNPLYTPYKRTELDNAYASYFGTASYTYDNRYTVFGSLRYDGSNLFGVDPKYKYLPIWSVSAAWNVHNETFMQDLEAISLLKFRASYGFQGNIDKSTSPFVVALYQKSSVLPGSSEDALQVATPPNDKLRWEKTENVGVGAEIGFLRNRINFIVDYYERKSTDLLTYRDLPQETGFPRTLVNYGEVTNKGWELTLNTLNIDHDNFSWTTSINFSKNTNTVDKLEENAINQRYPLGIGKPIDAIWVIEDAGLDENGLPQFYNENGEIVSAVEFYDLSDPYADFYPGYLVQSGLSDEERRAQYKYAGSSSPKWFGGLSNTFRYKNWDLSLNGSFTIGRKALAQPSYNFTAVDPGSNYTTDILDAWSPQNPNGTNPQVIGRGTYPDALVYNWFNSGDKYSTYYAFQSRVKELNYFRLNSIRLGYTIPSEYLTSLGFETFRLSMEGRNLFVLSNGYDGYFDPESYGNIYASPIQKSVTIGLNLNF
ncbi:MAG: SusC/RagA family TonB-linked outer membrane protein [Weeksellaceae bacterium]